jgi:hypothetical protein
MYVADPSRSIIGGSFNPQINKERISILSIFIHFYLNFLHFHISYNVSRAASDVPRLDFTASEVQNTAVVASARPRELLLTGYYPGAPPRRCYACLSLRPLGRPPVSYNVPPGNSTIEAIDLHVAASQRTPSDLSHCASGDWIEHRTQYLWGCLQAASAV